MSSPKYNKIVINTIFIAISGLYSVSYPVSKIISYKSKPKLILAYSDSLHASAILSYLQ